MMSKITLQTTGKPRLKRLLKVFLLLPLLSSSLYADPYDSLNDPRMDWYKAAKFGLMIHWGIYAEPAGRWSEENGSYDSWKEAIKNDTLQVFPGYAEQIQKNAQIPREEYKKIAHDFDWSDFNAQDVIDLCYATGQRYIVITAKHHDGFAMYQRLTHSILSKPLLTVASREEIRCESWLKLVMLQKRQALGKLRCASITPIALTGWKTEAIRTGTNMHRAWTPPSSRSISIERCFLR
jgi:hypothetical protein